MRPKRMFAALILGAAIGGTVVAASPAYANHFDNAGTTKVCTATGGGTFQCVLTLELSPGYFLSGGEVLSVNLSSGTNAQFVSAQQTGGACTLGPITVTPTNLTATTTSACQEGQTIVITENLVSTGAGGGPVCQEPDITGNFPIIQVCAPNFQAPPATPQTEQDCMNGGWAVYTSPAFKNQGDCVSFVATDGKNPPAG